MPTNEPSPNARRRPALHLVGGAGVGLCAVALVIETIRAIDGNGLSWVYVVEWPILGGFGIYLWRQLAHEERRVGVTTNRHETISALEAASRGVATSGPTEEPIDRD